jgi:hypothetical protein
MPTKAPSIEAGAALGRGLTRGSGWAGGGVGGSGADAVGSMALSCEGGCRHHIGMGATNRERNRRAILKYC